MPRKPGGKYKGKVGRAKGEATIAAELEAKRRKAMEANLAKLQERRQQDLLAKHGMQSAEEEALAQKMARIAQLFGQGKKGTLKKFWNNWLIGVVAMKRGKALDERQTCWRRSCDFCAPVPAFEPNLHGKFAGPHCHSCKSWWTGALGRTNWGPEMHPAAAAKDRPQVVNDNRACLCCGTDTGQPGMGCRCWHGLRETGFMDPSEQQKMRATTAFASASPSIRGVMSEMARSSSAPGMQRQKPTSQRLNLSVEDNWSTLRSSNAQGDVREYDPSEPFALTKKQSVEEQRRVWSDDLSAMAGSPMSRKRSGTVGLPASSPWNTFSGSGDGRQGTVGLASSNTWNLSGTGFPMLPPITPQSAVPLKTAQGKPLQEVTHWRTGQKTMLDRHLMKMFVVGVQ